MSDEQARATFRALRWHETGGEPVCPACGCVRRLRVPHPPLFKCKGCGKQFSRHQRHHLPRPQAAGARLPDGDRDLRQRRQGDQRPAARPRPRRVLQDRLRPGAQAARGDGRGSGQVPARRATSRSTAPTSAGTIRQENHKADRKDRRLAEHQTGKRRVVVVMRERQGRTLPFVVRAEDEGVAIVARRVLPGSHRLRRRGPALGRPARPLRHASASTTRFAFSDDGACTNQAESFFSPPAPGRVRPAPPHQRRLPAASTPARWRGARTCGARPTATSTSGHRPTRCTTRRAGTGAGTGSGTPLTAQLAARLFLLPISDAC